MVDWRRKLTSRKFWMAICGLITGIMVAFKVDSNTISEVSGIIMAAASVVAYIIGEGLADAANAETYIIEAEEGEGEEEDG